MENIIKAAKEIKKSKSAVAFTGAGISVESGIAPFRGENGIWNKYEEKLFEINYFLAHTKEAWDMLCDGFYEGTIKAQPNDAHLVLARLEKEGKIKAVITQNIDDLHTKAGSKTIYELHGNASRLHCTKDGSKYSVFDFDLKTAPKCKKCGSMLKPDFVFFGEQLPQDDFNLSIQSSRNCDLMLIIGSTGIVYPAASLPPLAKENGAKIIEINPSPSAFTNTIADIFIPMKAGEAMKLIEKEYSNLSKV
ncbi:MAG: NAD-dependent deacylase [Elusimicrobiota bacterium]|jgi:NAD-dependent deacetylase|nr:NAD-dependent deacylase [Elusimicrobiota bacterium]